MVTLLKMVRVGTTVVYGYVGKESDEKPYATNGSTFFAMDTGREFFFDGDEQGWFIPANSYLDSISIETPPTKTTYYVGDKFDATGIAVQALYSDETVKEVDNFTVEAPETLELDSIVKIKYVDNGRTRYAEPEITILPNEASDKESFMEIVQNGSAVVLVDDITISSALNLNKDFVLDLNGHELKNTSNANYMVNVTNGEVTIKNGAMQSKKRIGYVRNGGTLHLEGSVFTSTNDLCFDQTGASGATKITVKDCKFYAVEGGIGTYDGSTLEIDGAEFYISDNFAIFTNGTEGRGGNTIIVNDVYIDNTITSNGYEACGIYLPNADTFIMNGGTVIANGGCGILQRGGSCTINGGTIKATMGDHVPGWVGDLKGEEGKMPASAVIYHKHDNYKGGVGMELIINGGTFIGADASVSIISEEEHPNVTINGGAFVPPLA